MSDSHRFTWRLKDLMHANGIHQISALQRELQNHGIDLSSSQTHRLVTSTPDRLNLEVLSALCEVLSCSPSGLIEINYLARSKAVSADSNVVDLAMNARPRRAKVTKDED
ncbi:MAG: DNA-binding Xre family transcriptional regulator [Ilumatobacter sp.]|jgi:DNA-binding Xre family transcriptional regulator